jgi:hypothetical protein
VKNDAFSPPVEGHACYEVSEDFLRYEARAVVAAFLEIRDALFALKGF